MTFTPRLPLQADPGYLGDPVLVGGPSRSHLVTPQPPLLVVRKEAQQQLDALTVRLAALEARVSALESPGWWRRQWLALQAALLARWTLIRQTFLKE